MGQPMIRLQGRTTPKGVTTSLPTDIWRIADAEDHSSGAPLAHIVPAPSNDGTRTLSLALGAESASGPVIEVPSDLGHLTAGDVIAISPDGRRVNVLWKSTASHNSLLLTEQCDNYCLMCSQPPKDRDDTWLFGRAKRIISLLPAAAHSVGLTGGEPALHADELIDLLAHCRTTRPDLSLHLLSNGRRFADPHFTRRYANVGLDDIMIGIPLYAPEPALHDFIVQAEGAFDDTVHGILNLASLGQRTEIRIVIQRHTVPILRDLAVFIARNLPFIDQVALMGLEMTGLARPNTREVWVDPADYQYELAEAAECLTAAGIATKIYNHQLCVLDVRLWPLAVRSISDWKNDYLPVCATCSMRDECGGIFTTSGPRVSAHLHPIAGP
jgi:His-Xaa-Ser system radical SAM maturase HxsC